MTTELFRAIVDAMPFGVHLYRIDHSGDLVFAGYNAAASRILGVDHEMFLHKKIADAFPDLMHTEIPQRYLCAARGGSSWSTEQITYQDAKVKGAFRVCAFPTRPGEMAAIFEDITGLKQQEVQQKDSYETLEQRVVQRTGELMQANAELRELTGQLAQSGKQAALGELTAGLAHELSQPLNGIKIIAQGLMRDIVKKKLEPMTLGEKLLSVVEQTTKMGEILQHMRVFSQETSGPVLRAADANHIVKNALIFFEQQMIDINIAIEKVFSPEALMVMAVDIEVEQVVVNILSNARYALLKSGKSTKQLRVGVARLEGMASIVIEDNGTGMSEETLRRLFTPFFTTKQPGDGTGLALSVSKKIMVKNGGSIEVESKQGEYSRFTLLLPLA